jgi:hypothetical protein
MRWADLAGAAIGMRLAIFHVTTRFLIRRAVNRVRTLMMRGHPEPIDDSPDPQADYGELRASSRLPSLARDVELVERIGVPSNWQRQEFWYIF